MDTNTDPVRAREILAHVIATEESKGYAGRFGDEQRHVPEWVALEAIESALASAHPAEAQAQGGEEVAWRREWQGSGPQRGFHIREDVHLHNNRIVAYLGDQVDGDEVDKLIAAHNGKHPNGEPIRTAPPSAPVGVEGLAEMWKREAAELVRNARDARARGAATVDDFARADRLDAKADGLREAAADLLALAQQQG